MLTRSKTRSALALLLAIMMVVSLCPVVSAEAADDGFEIVDGVLISYTGTESTVTIPDTVKTIGNGSKSVFKSTVSSVIMPSSVTKIASKAFYGWVYGRDVNITFSDSLKEIGSYAFDECYFAKGTVIDLPASVEKIDNSAFGVFGEDSPGVLIIRNKAAQLGTNIVSHYGFNVIVAAPGSTAEKYVTDLNKPEKVTFYSLNDYDSAETFKVTPEKVQLKRQATVQLEAEGIPAKAIAWSSSNEEVATVSSRSSNSGLVTAVQPGTATITGKFGKLTGSCTVTVYKAAEESDFTINSAGLITGYIGSETPELEIPATVNGTAVTGIADAAFKGNKGIEKVILPEGCKTIGKEAFSGASALSDINLDHVTEMGKDAFAQTGFTSLTIGPELEIVPEGAFRSCSSLKSLILTGKVKELGVSAFSGCSSLASITLNEGLETIHEFALFRAPIATLHFPSTFKQLGDGNVGDPFEEGGKMEASTAMTTVTVADDSPYFASKDGLLYSKDMKTVVFCPRGRTEATIAEGTENVGPYAFFMCFDLQKVELPKSLKTVGKGAFQYDEGITDMELPEGLETVEQSGFFGCELWTGVDRLPKSLKSIGAYGFAECLGTKLTIPEGITEIPEFAFWGYEDHLQEINLPSTLKTIGNSAFSWAKDVKTLVIPEGVTSIGREAFGRLDALESLTLPSTLKTIGDKAFMGGSDVENMLKEVTVPASVTSYGNDVFLYRDSTKINRLVNEFDDVKADDWFHDSVVWATLNGITDGTGSNMFSPALGCTRAHIVTMMYRMAGSPSVDGLECKFTDVPSDIWYRDAVLWAADKGITLGTSETTFSPDDTCTRAQIVTMLYRYAGSPVVRSTPGFTDVRICDYYSYAVIWAAENGIANGRSSTEFAPADTCTRCEAVAFLHRAESILK